MIELRKTSGAVAGKTLSGYAVLWDTPSVTIHERGRTFVETIKRGAFDRSLAEGKTDVKLLYQHQGSQILARTRNDSLRLSQDERGLKFEATLPDTTLGSDVRELLTSGTLSGEMSFGFSAVKDSWTQGNSRREVLQADLFELSVVIDAAYPQTSAALRSQGDDNWADQLRIRICRNRLNG
jgi:hypothetical protein